MINKTLITTVISISLLLSACGGGGSSSTSTLAQATPIITGGGNTNTGNTNTGNTNNNGMATVSAAKTGLNGNIISFTRGKAGNNTATGNTGGINKVIINGRTVDFIPQGFNTNTINIQAGNMTRVGSGNSLTHSRYGYLVEGAGTPHLFSQGNVTANAQMPSSGTATYIGNAVHITVSQDGKNISTTTPTANFNVDFGAKTLTGQINTAQRVELSGTIRSNTFSGTKNGVTTNGYFFGDRAAELGGTYKNADGTVSGAYGAKK